MSYFSLWTTLLDGHSVCFIISRVKLYHQDANSFHFPWFLSPSSTLDLHFQWENRKWAHSAKSRRPMCFGSWEPGRQGKNISCFTPATRSNHCFPFNVFVNVSFFIRMCQTCGWWWSRWQTCSWFRPKTPLKVAPPWKCKWPLFDRRWAALRTGDCA